MSFNIGDFSKLSGADWAVRFDLSFLVLDPHVIPLILGGFELLLAYDAGVFEHALVVSASDVAGEV